MHVCCCRFKLKALPGHSKAGQKVTYGVLKGAKFKQLALVLLLCLMLRMILYKSHIFSVVSKWSDCVQQATDKNLHMYFHVWGAAEVWLV